MYTGCTVGRDGTGEFFGATIRVDNDWLSPAYQRGATLRDIIIARTYKLDSRAIIRIPF